MMIIVFYCTRKTAFDELMDGIYGVAASLGYAAWENIDYVLFYINEFKIVYDPHFM